MSTESKNFESGPAFPTEGNWVNGLTRNCGMSLREWLAGKALSGVLSNQDFIIRVLNYDNPVRPSDNSQKLFDEAAALAVRAADATLKELNKA